MNSIKKLSALLLAVSLVFSAAACKNNVEESTSEIIVSTEDINASNGETDSAAGNSSQSDENKASVNNSGSKSTKIDTKAETKSGYTLPDVKLKDKTLDFYVPIGVTVEALRSPDKSKGMTATNLFEDVYGGKMRMIQVDSNKFYETLLSYQAAGNMPDMIYPYGSYFPRLYLYNLIDTLDQYKPYIDLSAPIWDNYREYNENMAVNGKHYYAIQEFGSPVIIAYNPKLFSRFDVEKTPFEIYRNNPADWTWSKMRELAAQLTQDTDGDGKTDIYGLGLSGDGGSCLLPTTGTNLITYDAKKGIKSNLYSEQLKNTANFVRDLFTTYKVADPDAPTTVESKFKNGTLGMITVGMYKLTGDLKSLWKEGKVGVAPLPRYDGVDKSYRGGIQWAYLIGKGCDNPEAAALWMTLSAYCTSGYLEKDYGVPNYDQNVVYLGMSEIPKEQSKLMYEMYFDNKQFTVLPSGGSWINGSSYELFEPLRVKTWNQILAQKGPAYDASIKENWEQYAEMVAADN